MFSTLVLSVARSFHGVRFFNSDFVVSHTVRIPVPNPDKTLAPLSLACECPSQGRILFVSWRIIPLQSPEMSALHSVVFFPCPDGSLPPCR